VFLENVTDPRLLQQIAAETAAKIGGTIYSDSLSPPNGPAAIYVDMMHHNGRAFQRALTS
jgi:zinc/manganese transport system substrate-binding protein